MDIGKTEAFGSLRQWLGGLLIGVGAVVWCYRGFELGGSRLGQSLCFLHVGDFRGWSWTVGFGGKGWLRRAGPRGCWWVWGGCLVAYGGYTWVQGLATGRGLDV
ncbi:hypothetical protein CIPAW_14G079200 [Carya illinoinensis]|uniref:Uncharacterized protein n=1 Tax=Carya illinoinensis TaxID=32201 RepID=A0A8T1NKD7_CARIL|nr:hypothetical protein CIPAW_14G079200 [Carya illinoinensis]